MAHTPFSHASNNHEPAGDSEEELERLLTEGVSFAQANETSSPQTGEPEPQDDDDNEDRDVPAGSDLQGALALFAEAGQDMATAGLELNLGRHFACVDYCNQVAEKAAQAVSLLRFGRRSLYDHDLRALGERVGAPPAVLEDMAALTPFHPEAFYAETPPEEADEVISAEEAGNYLQCARRVLRWARDIILSA